MLASNVTSIEINESYISQESVKVALNSLRYSSQGQVHNPLENTALVNQMITNLALPPSIHIRAYALDCLLTGLIERELIRHRRACDIPLFGNDYSLRELGEAIARDARTSNPELISWSWLYYHFVRVEFNLLAQDFSRMAFIKERTLRRYQEHGIWRLTQHLIAREQRVRARSASIISMPNSRS